MSSIKYDVSIRVEICLNKKDIPQQPIEKFEIFMKLPIEAASSEEAAKFVAERFEWAKAMLSMKTEGIS